ncbi:MULTISPECIES: transporter substrate-binding domain-containing protein [Ochrobactrum]|uniref:transporter substrate-binding domain-containing protein n=1 Tax=Ochrobactrum TaxID=528 RepID=UPI002B05C820|nr:transporter substrate-binding domain-containing protein [Ochrobactrum chromiisoli]
MNIRIAVIATDLLASCYTHTDEVGKAGFDEILSRGILKVGTTGDYSPFTFKDPKTGEYQGFDIDLAKNLANPLGVRIEFVPTSWPTLTQDFNSHKFDIAMGGISITLERQKMGLFSFPYLQDGKAPIARCADHNQYISLADIDKPNVKVIVNPGGQMKNLYVPTLNMLKLPYGMTTPQFLTRSHRGKQMF